MVKNLLIKQWKFWIINKNCILKFSAAVFDTNVSYIRQYFIFHCYGFFFSKIDTINWEINNEVHSCYYWIYSTDDVPTKYSPCVFQINQNLLVQPFTLQKIQILLSYEHYINYNEILFQQQDNLKAKQAEFKSWFTLAPIEYILPMMSLLNIHRVWWLNKFKM